MGNEISRRKSVRRPRQNKRSPSSTTESADVESNYNTYYGNKFNDPSTLDLTFGKHGDSQDSSISSQKKSFRRRKRKDVDKSGPNFAWMHSDSFNDTHAIGLQTVVKTLGDKDRMRTEHEVFKYVLNGSFKAPVHDLFAIGGALILDIGCGVCSWTLDNARTYTQSEFHGLDIDGSLFPPTVPSNCYLTVGDITKPLPYNDNTFDFVFSRNMGSSAMKEEWPRLLLEFVRVCKPGGYIELLEPNFKLQSPGPTFTQWNDAFSASFESRDFDALIGPNIPALLDDIPSISVLESDYVSAPVGWGGTIGELVLYDIKMAFVTMKQGLLAKMNISNEQYDEMIQTCLRECAEHETFINLHYSYAQKDTGI